MYKSQLPIVTLYEALLSPLNEHRLNETIRGWLDKNQADREWVSEFKRRTNNAWYNASREDLCRIYSLSRVTEILLYQIQSLSDGDVDSKDNGSGMRLFREFHEQLGFTIDEGRDFHPIFHEICAVTRSADDNSQIEISEYLWPSIVLGELQFFRAGVRINAGSSRVCKEVAETSKLYWANRRAGRSCDDLSHGWGSNSRWRTQFRRDYATNDQFAFNVDGNSSLNNAADYRDDIPIDAMVELIRYRHLVRRPLDDADLFPYDYNYVERLDVEKGEDERT